MQDTTLGSLAQQLAPVLDPIQEGIKNMHCRVVPSTSNSGDPYLRALPLAREWRWPSLESHLTRFRPETLIVQLPSFWQVEPLVHAASRAAGAPVCIVEPQNYPLDKAAIRLASANAILAEAGEAGAIADYLHAGQVALPPFWILIHAGDAPSWSTPHLLKSPGLQVAQEVHMAPGVPLLVQCADIVGAQSGTYHRSDLFAWSDDLAHPSVSTHGSLLFELKDFALPFALKDVGACACGKQLLARTL